MLKNQQEFSNHIDGQSEMIIQARNYLRGISTEAYQAILAPHFTGSAGAHMRHILDHYIALKDGLVSGTINYNKRNRYSEVELSPQAAMQKWLEIEHWLVGVGQLDAEHPLTVICEVSLQHSQNSSSQSTLARELMFVSSHAVHHFALLAVIASLQGEESDNDLGVAPTTASHQRKRVG